MPDSSLTFYGVVDCPFGFVANAYVEASCQCGWKDSTYTNNDGEYELYGGNHEGHTCSIGASKLGFLAVVTILDPMGVPPTESNFTLQPEP